MTSSIGPRFLVAGYSIDGEPISVESCEVSTLSAKWLQICSDFLASHGSIFDDSWGQVLSDYRIKFTSASGSAIVTFYVHNDIALSLLLMSGTSSTADREVAEMFVESLAESELVKAAKATQHPFSGFMSHKERPLVVMVPWANAAISEQEYDVVGELSLHLAGAFFSHCIASWQS